ncbi:hypothetical protein TNCV_4670161 [Trichonephila clavipes]|nr:hypothetical protein TNCV_4670161 [Trichonephila clavipes]
MNPLKKSPLRQDSYKRIVGLNKCCPWNLTKANIYEFSGHAPKNTTRTPYDSNIQKILNTNCILRETNIPCSPTPWPSKPIHGPTVLQMVHASHSPSRPSTQDGRRRWTKPMESPPWGCDKGLSSPQRMHF